MRRDDWMRETVDKKKANVNASVNGKKVKFAETQNATDKWNS